MTFELFADRFAVVRLDPSAEIPSWARGQEFLSVTRTRNELSIVCEESLAPPDVKAERGWRCLELAGPIPFDQTGVAAAFLDPLASAAVGVFVVSTYDTDYLLVKDERLDTAIDALREAGYEIRSSGRSDLDSSE